MMGRKQAARKLFYEFSLEERVPRDHFLCRLAKAIDFSFVYSMVKPYYSHTGAPSVDPVVVLKMALIFQLVKARLKKCQDSLAILALPRLAAGPICAT